MERKMSKKIIIPLLCLCLFAVPVYADDEEQVTPQENTTTPVVVNITDLLNSTNNSTDEDKLDTVVAVEPELVNMTQSLQKVSAEDTTGFKAVMLSLLGDYETTITDYEYRTGTSNYTSHSISIERDWTWICSCGIFAILLICTFKTIGAIASKI